jgi:hypothetical protein
MSVKPLILHGLDPHCPCDLCMLGSYADLRMRGTEHLHSKYVDGCFRCDLSREETRGVR